MIGEESAQDVGPTDSIGFHSGKSRWFGKPVRTWKRNLVHAGVGILVLVGGSARAVEPEDVPKPPGRIVLAASQVVPGQKIQGWLVVDDPAPGDLIEIEAHEAAQVWFPREAGNCRDSKKGASTAKPLSPSGVSSLCGRLNGEEPARFVVRLSRQSTKRTHLVASDLIEPLGGWFEPSPAVLALLSALAGLVAGMLSHMMKDWWDNRARTARLRADVVNEIVQQLLPEWMSNAKNLREYVDAARDKTPPIMAVSGYNKILGDKGAMAFLKSEHSGYFERIDRLYDRLRLYNRLCYRKQISKEDARLLLGEIEGSMPQEVIK